MEDVHFVLMSPSLMEIALQCVLNVMKNSINSKENASRKKISQLHSHVITLKEGRNMKDVQCAINLAFYQMHFVFSVLKAIC